MINDQNDSPTDPTEHRPGNSDFGSPSGHLSGDKLTMTSIVPVSLSEELDGQHRQPDGESAGGARRSIESALEFRVIRPGAPVRRLRLTGNRYTFGSGEGCSIRLDDPSLRPMHAVLLRDAHRILMRAYSVPLECNGTRVTESVLRLGDVIRMGNYRFELLAAPGSIEGFSNKLGPATGTRNAQLKDRLTELSQQWHARHAECEVRETRCDQRESELYGRETELWSRSESLQRRENLLLAQEAAAKEIQETYAATQQELKSLRLRESEANEALQEKEAELLQKSLELQERQAELQRRQAEWQQRETQYAERAAQAQLQLEQTQQQAQTASEAVGRMREEFASLNEQLTELRERHSDLQAREKREQEEHDRLRGELESSRDEAVDSHAKSEARRSEAEQELQRVSTELESTRQQLDQLRQDSKQCQQELNERLRATGEQWQATREESERSRREAEEDQAYAEKRISELEEHLARVQEHQLESDVASQQEIAELKRDYEVAQSGRENAEQVAEALRDNIQQLQDDVAQANQKATRLQTDFEGANASVRQLELLVDQSKNNQSAQQDSWTQESEQLQRTIEELSIQLSNANAELSQLRSANEALSSELSEAQSETERGQSEEQAASDSERFRILEQELDSARKDIERLKSSHDETVARLQNEREESESALRDEIDRLQEEIATAQLAAEAKIQQIAESGHSFAEGLPETPLAEQTDAAGNEALDWSASFEDDSAMSGSDDGDAESDPMIDQAAATTGGSSAAAESIIETGETFWRMESGQGDDQVTEGEREALPQASSVQVDPEQVDPEQVDPEQVDPEQVDPEQSEPVQSDDDLSSEPSGDSHGVSWHDEPPEHAVTDAIEDIEHNVGQALADYQSPDETTWPDPIDDQESQDATVNESVEPGGQQSENEKDPVASADIDDSVEAEPHDEAASQQDLADTGAVREDASLSDDAAGPLDWSAYMPGGPIDESEPVAAEQGDVEQDGSRWDHSESASELNPAESQVADNPTATDSSWTSPGWGEQDESDSVHDHEANSPYGATEQWTGASDEQLSSDPPESLTDPGDFGDQNELADQASAADGALIDEQEVDEQEVDDNPVARDDSSDEYEYSTGSLADMLIRDLAADDVDHSARVSNDPEPEFDDPSEESIDPTFVLDSQINFAEEDSGETSGEWNLDSPSDLEDETTDETEAETSYAEQTSLEDDGKTTVAPGIETIIAPHDLPEDDSIEAYMSRLLQRVQGDDELPLPAAAKPPADDNEPPASDSTVDEPIAEELEEPRDSVSPETPLKDSVPLVPRSHAPELSRNLSAMRELANQSARNAVSRSIRVQARDTQMKAVFKGLTAACFIAMAIGAFILLDWSPTIEIAMVGAFVVLAGVFAQEAYVLSRDARRRLELAEVSIDETKDDEEIAEEIKRIAEEAQGK